MDTTLRCWAQGQPPRDGPDVGVSREDALSEGKAIESSEALSSKNFLSSIFSLFVGLFDIARALPPSGLAVSQGNVRGMVRFKSG